MSNTYRLRSHGKEIDLNKFTKWLQDQGGEILPLTNQWEVLRFRGTEVGVLYSSGKTNGSFASASVLQFAESKGQGRWKGRPTATTRVKQGGKVRKRLAQRDGSLCFFCLEELGRDITIEHLIPLTAGGTDRLGNKVLAHKACNQKAGSRPLLEKIQIRFEAWQKKNS